MPTPTPINRDPEDLERDWRARQQNLTWPNTRKNGRSVDEFLWKGSPNATLVQRAGVLLIGGFFACAGIAFFVNSWSHGEKVGVLISLIPLGGGLKVASNAFRKR